MAAGVVQYVAHVTPKHPYAVSPSYTSAKEGIGGEGGSIKGELRRWLR